MTRILTRSGVMTAHFARLFALAVLGCVAMAAIIFSYAPVGATPPAGEPSGPYSPPSTQIIYNRDDRDNRAVDQNRLFYENASSATNNASATNVPSNLVPSGQTTTTGATPDVESGTGADNTQSQSITSEQEDALQELLPTEKEIPTRPITRTRALADALAENYDIRIKVYDEEAAQALIRQARGAFDPVFNAEGSYEDIRDPQNTQDFVATGGTPGDIVDDMPRIFRENNEHYKIALDGTTEIGTQYEFKSQLDVLSNTLNQTSPLALFTPEWQSFTGVTIDQPFLRGFGTDVNNSEIRAAIVNKLAEKYSVQDQVLTTVSQVMQAYYEITYLSEELDAKREDRDLGVRLVRDRFKALEKGQVTSREVNRVESTLAEIIEDFTKAQNELIDQQTVLAALISSDLNHADDFVYHPTTEMPEPHLDMNVDQLVTQALLHRPKYLEARERVEEQNIKLVYARNQTWPQLDLKGTYGVNGLSGSFGDSYYREIIPQGPQWSVGLSFSFVFGNNDAQGKVDEIDARKTQALLNLKQVELDTNLLVRKLVATYRSDEARYRAMEVFSRTAEENLDDEKLRLEKGLSSDLDVLKYRRDSTEASARRLAALADLNVAYVQIMEATGMLLDKLNIQFAPGAP